MPVPNNRLKPHFAQMSRQPVFPFVLEDMSGRTMTLEMNGLKYVGKELVPDHVVATLVLWRDDFRPGPIRDCWTQEPLIFSNELITLSDLFCFLDACKSWERGMKFAEKRPHLVFGPASLHVLEIEHDHATFAAFYSFRKITRLFRKKILTWTLAIERQKFNQFLRGIEGVRNVI